MTGKLGRTAWRLRKNQNDLGDFATAIDKFMEDRDSLGIDIFFLVVAHWAGVDDDDDTEDGEGRGRLWSTDTPQVGAVPERPVVESPCSSDREGLGTFDLEETQGKLLALVQSIP